MINTHNYPCLLYLPRIITITVTIQSKLTVRRIRRDFDQLGGRRGVCGALEGFQSSFLLMGCPLHAQLLLHLLLDLFWRCFTTHELITGCI